MHACMAGWLDGCMDFQIHIQNPKHVCAIIRMYTYVCMYVLVIVLSIMLTIISLGSAFPKKQPRR